MLFECLSCTLNRIEITHTELQLWKRDPSISPSCLGLFTLLWTEVKQDGWFAKLFIISRQFSVLMSLIATLSAYNLKRKAIKSPEFCLQIQCFFGPQKGYILKTIESIFILPDLQKMQSNFMKLLYMWVFSVIFSKKAAYFNFIYSSLKAIYSFSRNHSKFEAGTFIWYSIQLHL